MSEDSTNRLDVFQELPNLQEYDYKFRDETAGGPSVFYALVLAGQPSVTLKN
jgi:hypothetical protein